MCQEKEERHVFSSFAHILHSSCDGVLIHRVGLMEQILKVISKLPCINDELTNFEKRDFILSANSVHS